MPPKAGGKKANARGGGAAASSSSGQGVGAATPGMVFKGRWRLGKLLGEGACASVHEVEDITGGGGPSGVTWVIKVAALGSGKVVSKGKRKVDPQKKNADTLYWEHMIYNTYLRGMSGIPLLPEQQAFGDDQGFRFLVMQRLGRTLMEVRNHRQVDEGGLAEKEKRVKDTRIRERRESQKVTCLGVVYVRIQEFEAQGKAWSPSVVADFGKQVLTTLQSLHDRQLIFVDVKPENFMLGSVGTVNAGRVYLVDFGLVARYTAFDGGHKAQVKEGMGGTPLYVSLACHQGSTPARRDDIEALGYVLTMFLRGGNLPWEDVSSDAECLAKKKATTLEALCAGVPGGQVMIDFLRRARDTSFEAKPDYQAFHTLLDRLGKEKAAPSSKASASRRGKGTAAGASSSGTSKAAGGSSSTRKEDAAANPTTSRRGGKSQSNKKGDHDVTSVVAEEHEDEGEERAAGEGKARRTSKRVRQSSGKAGSPPKRQQVEVDEGEEEDAMTEEGSSSSWLSFVTEPVKFLVRSLSGVPVEDEGADNNARGGKGRKGRRDKKEEEEEEVEEVIDLTSGKVAAGQEEDDDEVMVVDAPRATRSSARVGGSSSSKPTATRQRKSASASTASADSSSASSALALEVIEGPHAGERFVIDGSGAVYGGRGASGAVSLPRDRDVELKHCSIKPGQTRSQSLRIAPVGGRGNVILVNGVQVSKSGRDIFIGDVLHIGTSKLILQKC